MKTEEEIRALVRQAVAEALAAADSASGEAGSSGGGQTSTSADAATPGAETAGGIDASRPPTAAGPIALGADHGGFALKQMLAAFLRERGWQVVDCGTDGPASVDYPDFAHEVARRVADGSCRWGIVVDGAGIGSAMAANKVPGVRAALCYDRSTARNSREHNHANVLTLGAGLIGEELARQIVEEWLATPWGLGRHARRVEKIRGIEERYSRPRGGNG
jgi:ribose 5-phosphate isomerase B